MNPTKIILPCFALLLCISSCCLRVTHDLPPSYIDHMFFPVGSEWVMQNNLSGQEDTIRCTRSVLGTTPLCSSGDIECDNGPCDDEISSQNLNLEFHSNIIEPDSNLGRLWTVTDLEGGETGISVFGELMFIDPMPQNSIEDLSFVATYPTLIIQNTPYSNVSEFLDVNSHFFDGGAASYFFAPEVGWVKFEDESSGETWEVVSWHH